MRSLVVTISLAFAVSATGGNAQETPTAFGETMEVRIINVDVVVLGEDGQPLHGLTADDFVILEDGQPQAITNFAEYRADAATMPDSKPEDPAPATLPVKPPEKRYLLFFVDSLNLREPINRQAFFDGLRSFLDSAMREGDEAAIYYWTTSLETLVAMTSDRTRLDEAFRKIEEESRLRIDRTDMELSEIAIRDRMRQGDPLATAQELSEEKATDARYAARRAFDLQQRKINAVNYVIQASAGLEGRKVMILATDRLSKLPGLEYGHGYGLMDKELSARKQLDSVVRNANSAGVTVYGFFPKGIEKDLPTSADTESGIIEVSDVPTTQATQAWNQLMNQAEPIDSIASRTGGISALGGKLSGLALANTARQLDNYYSLAYRAPDNRLDRSRSIKVEVDRPGVTVLARSSIVGRSDDEVIRDRIVSGVLFGELHSEIDIGVTQKSLRTTGGSRYRVGVDISIPVAQLTMIPSGKRLEGKFRVYTVAANPDDEVSDVVEKSQAFDVSARDVRKAMASWYTYSLDIDVRDTTNRLMIAVVDDLDGEMGYALLTLDLSPGARRDRKDNEIPMGPVDYRKRP